MTPEAEAITKIFMAVKPELMWTLFQTSIIAIVILLLHKLLKSIAAYISFRINKDIGKNVKIVLRVLRVSNPPPSFPQAEAMWIFSGKAVRYSTGFPGFWAKP